MVLPSDQEASGRTFDAVELDLVAQVLRSGTLTSTKGTMVARFVDPLAGLLIALATARCTAPVIRDAVQSLRASTKHRRAAATGLRARPMTSDAGG